MSDLYLYPALITVINVVLLIGLAMMTGWARGKGQVKTADTFTTDNVPFIRANRVHLNTLENTVVFLPLLWISAFFWSVNFASIIGLIWLLSRVAFAVLYRVNPVWRIPAFAVGLLCLIVLALGCFWGLGVRFLTA